MSELSERNKMMVERVRASPQDSRLLLLTTTGARTGERRTVPLIHMADGDTIVVAAGGGGSPTNPGWYHNVVANPSVTVEVGTDTFDGTASVASGAERERLWGLIAEKMPITLEHQQKVKRQIPVVVLQRGRV
jgi:deazaflavin-dependent oxidoreductase (nitroreductase family)